MSTAVRRVVIAADLSRASEPFLAAVAELFKDTRDELVFLHICNVAEFSGVHDETGLAFDQYTDSIRWRLQEATRRLLPASPVRVEVVPNDSIVDGILAAAEREAAGMIVMGTHGRRGLPRLVLGSIAEAVLRRATVPVLVVPLAALEPRASPAAVPAA
jgi:nucleotide-binding universal stress UspA family protein